MWATKVPWVKVVPTTSKVASLVAPDGGSDDTVPSGKAGIGVAVTDAIGVYGEVSFIGSGDDAIDRGYGGKLGVKYNF